MINMHKYNYLISIPAAALTILTVTFLPCSAEQAPLTAPPASGQKKFVFTFQVDAVGTKERAYALEESLMDKGYPAYIEEVSDNAGNTTYQVRIGKYPTRADAEKAARAFYEREKKPYWITAAELDTKESVSSSSGVAPDAEYSSKLPPPQSVEELGTPPEHAEKPATTTAGNTLPNSASRKTTAAPSPEEQKPQGAVSTTTFKAPAHSDSNWPPTVTRIYTYFDAQGYLRVTNNEQKIPAELRDRIESVSIFPVKYLSFNQKKKMLLVDIAGRQEELQLAGVDLDTAAALAGAAAYCETALKNVPLRLKFTPEHPGTDKKKIVRGNLFFKQGASVNIELLRKGIAPCDADALPPSQKQAFLEAEAAARNERIGIWETYRQ